MLTICRYSSEREEEWDQFVTTSRQGTFLFLRRYMDYHSDRFHDHSLMIYKDSRLYAMLPGNEDGEVYCSHQGLTYGGLLTQEDGMAASVCEIFLSLNDYLRGQGFRQVVYKPVPWIYHRLPSEEDLYALFKECHARLTVRNIASTIDLSRQMKWQRLRRRAVKYALAEGIVVEESTDLATFWQILEDNLMRNHHARPVHTLEEMRLLMTRCPENIRLFAAYRDNEMLGAVMLYITPQVVHAQYSSATEKGKRLHAIDAIYRFIIDRIPDTFRYFDFGTSNEQQGRVLNANLIFQKEGFGGRAVVYDTYMWDLDDSLDKSH